MLINLTTLTPTMRTILRQLVTAITAFDGISPINESGALCIEGLREADFFLMGLRADPHGFAIADARDQTIMVGVHPDHRGEGVAEGLLREVAASYPDYSAWAFGTLPAAVKAATRAGLEPVRELLRMERPLTTASVAPVPAGCTIASYRPEFREGVVRVNAAAFAHHPEQGRLTLEEFDQLVAQDWFDPAGLLVAVQDGKPVGFHWTKRHGDGLGEVYVLAVHPEHEGQGLGATLLGAGLAYLQAAGDVRVELYVERSQERVVRMYLNAGFAIVQIDTSFRAKRGRQ